MRSVQAASTDDSARQAAPKTRPANVASMTSVRALVFLGDGRMELRELPTPDPARGEVRVRVVRAAVCGTDLHKRRRPPERQPRHGEGRPLVSGHEPVGVVDAVGPGVPAARIGERVIVAGVFGCGSCLRCADGFNTACEASPGALHATADGSNADFMLAPSANALALPDGVTFDDAAVLACAGGTAATALADARATDDDRIAVVGLGAVGLSAVLLGRALGARVVGFDPNPRRRAKAIELGASAAASPADLDPAAARTLAGRPGFDVVVECAGGGARPFALGLARRRGRIALAGLGVDPWSPDPIPDALVLIGVAATPLVYLRALLERTARARLPFAAIVSHRLPLEEAEAAFALMERGEATKVVFDVER